MADTLTLSILGKIDWTWQDTMDLSIVSDEADIKYDASWLDGSGVAQVEKIWHDTRQVAGSSNDDLDLTALTNTIFGQTHTISLTALNLIFIVNKNTVSGDDLYLDATVTNSISFNYAADLTTNFFIPAAGPFLQASEGDWPVVNSSTDILRIANNSSNAVDYDIVLGGS